jgi:23S rRNA pseudouridine1911/1915/1917 synthase
MNTYTRSTNVKLTPEILFEDSEIVVLNKPAGLLVLPDRYDMSAPNVYTSLRDRYGEVFVVHRIDKETSGLVVFAKTKEAHASLSQQFEQRAVEKNYQAICVGAADQSEGTVHLSIAESDSKKGKMKIVPKNGKESITHFRVLERFAEYTYLAANPKTGRTHQIRVHLSAINLPILGDNLYGGGSGFFLSNIKSKYRSKGEEKPLLNRTALHAGKISFAHPKSGALLSFEAELPKDMRIVLNYLRKLRSL